METLLIISLFILFYSYLGYGLVMWIYGRKKTRRESEVQIQSDNDLPTVAVLIPAYNEEDVIEEKILNTDALNYPQMKKSVYVITDGSTDRTAELVKRYNHVVHLHVDQRNGKVGAINRAMDLIHAEITVSTDSNTTLNPDALKEMVKHFQHSNVIAVSGEKKVRSAKADDAGAAGEGIYWKYESFLKKMDSQVNTMVGAAGELIAFRTNRFERIPQNTILEDFFMTMRFAEKGYKVAYEPKAFAEETPSASIKEELKRKVRISAGAFQAMRTFKHLLDPRKFNFLSFQYLSHRVLRWTAAPVSLLVFFIANMFLVGEGFAYDALANLQVTFYGLAIIGFVFKRYKVSFKALHVPYYFCMMNYAVIAGYIRFLRGNQSVTWEKALRRA